MTDKVHDDSKILWAPWRMEYIANCDKPIGCIFCTKPKENKDKENLIVYRGAFNFIIMNRYPYNNGHLMIVPYKHTCALHLLNSEEKSEWLDLIELSQVVLNKVMKPHGFNIGMNMGRVAGAGIAEHLHFHIVPRWLGDTNAFTVFAEVRVIPEHIQATYNNLKPHFDILDLKN